MPRIGFLHTSPIHTPTFDALVADLSGRESSITTVVVVDEGLLSRAREFGPDDEVVRSGILRALGELEQAGASAIVCTCSTVGGSAESIGEDRGVPVIRIDRPMATAAVTLGPRIAVVAALSSTLRPTRQLIESVAITLGRSVELSEHLCDGAWERFEAGDQQGYLTAIAATCADVAASSDVIVLAQASMAEAASLVSSSIPILSSPRLAVAAALACLVN